MMRTRQIFIGTASALALAALPVNLASLGSGSLESSAAFAKNGGGEGKGGGGGHGGGHGGGGGGHGKSGDHGKSGKSGSSKAKADSGGAKSKSQTLKSAKSKQSAGVKLAKASKKNTDTIETAALPEEAAPPKKEQKLNARLAGLNSLNRNFHAYLASQDPRMAKIRDFVMASANLDSANAGLADAQDAFDQAVVDRLKSFDPTAEAYTDPSVEDLEARLDELDPVADADEIDAINDVLDKEGASLTTAEQKAELAATGTDDAALKEALLDAANRNRVAEYGENNYVNDEVMDWAKDVLGVGDAVGKIDEVRDSLDETP